MTRERKRVKGKDINRDKGEGRLKERYMNRERERKSERQIYI